MINNNASIELLTKVETGETVSINSLDSGSTYNHVYNTLIVLGSATTTTEITLNNNVTFALCGGTILRYPINSITVGAGDGVLLTGYKQSKQIF